MGATYRRNQQNKFAFFLALFMLFDNSEYLVVTEIDWMSWPNNK